MKIKKQYKFGVTVLAILLIIVVSGCAGGGKKKKPNAPEITEIEKVDKLNKTELLEDKLNKTELINQKDIAEAKKTCQEKGGINCQGCCKSPIFSTNVFTCCAPKGCIERIQLQIGNEFENLENVTIERFPKGNYGIWYGEKDKNFGVRQYVNAENTADNTYRFIVNGVVHQFTITDMGCSISIDDRFVLINETFNTTGNFGNLFIESEPSNASLSLDGVFKGLTPILLTQLIPVIYEIALSKEGYQDSVAYWTIIAERTTNISIILKPLTLVNQTNDTFINQTELTNFSMFNETNQTLSSNISITNQSINTT